jgi:hypothetical protein
MAKTNDFSYEVTKKLGTLGEDSKIELRIVAWNGKPAKLDLRTWFEKDGEEKCGKGIALTNDEAKELVNLLNAYFEEDEDDDF